MPIEKIRGWDYRKVAAILKEEPKKHPLEHLKKEGLEPFNNTESIENCIQQIHNLNVNFFILLRYIIDKEG